MGASATSSTLGYAETDPMGIMTFRSLGWQRFGRVVTAIFAVLSIGYLMRPFLAGTPGANVQAGKPLPTFPLHYLKNGPPEVPGGAVQQLRLSSLVGKPVLVSFWEPWCGYCVDEMPTLQRLHEKWAPRAVVVAVSGEDAHQSFEFISRPSLAGLTFPFVFDTGGRLGRALAVRKLPFTVFLDATGNVASSHTGVISEGEASEVFEALLNPAGG